MRTSTLAAWLGALCAVTACSAAGAGNGGRHDAVDRTVASGTTIDLRTTDSLSSRHNHRGDPVTAVSMRDVLDARNAVVIPAGTLFRGRVLAIAPAERPGQSGVLEIDVNALRMDDEWRSVPVRVVSVDSRMQGRGVTTGDVAKVGAGTVIGGIAGRVIGGNRTGTVVGAAAGTAAGAAYAHETRDIDVVLPKGSAIRIVLTRSFTVTGPATVAGR